MEIKKTAIIGMGSLGMLYGTFLLDAGQKDVAFVMDDERYEKNSGETFYKNGNAYTLPIVRAKDAKAADLVIAAVKYTGLEAALDVMAGCIGPNTIIMSVMNGITSEEIIGKRFGMQHMVYTVAQGMDAGKFGSELKFTKMGELRFGAKDETQTSNVKDIARFFDKVKMPYTIDKDIMRRLWGKFMLNVGVNQACMVYETNYGGVLKKGEPNMVMISAMREVIALANALGIDLGENDINEYVEILKTLSPEGMPSMRQDGLAKRKSEVDMFSGAVIELGQKYGIYVPVNEFLNKKVHEMEAKY